MSNGKSFQIDKGVFWPPFIALLVVVATSLIADEAFLGMAKTAFNWVNNTFGWAFALSTLAFALPCFPILLTLFFYPSVSPLFLLSTLRWVVSSAVDLVKATPCTQQLASSS